ncbi:hypothetical protein H6G33_11760 [Calothrix sp. FACHB-1219]|uniref:hypothetical protein n=1 Tax=unclassified Calothrix TaxID=2619626 RepID=UPI00168845EA|nr:MULTISPECIES: hypothetical protein [unclassified Calothrix]MBD2202301.1 hypothetical protein [Calothrix sp. FACHB-168]MBD2217707.1 hypothetical protein [Calothrix sp. FACHB-1219]
MKEIVNQALTSGYLSLAAQHQIRLLLQSEYDSEDLDAYIILQRAVLAGDVKQESRVQKSAGANTAKDGGLNIKQAYQVAAEIACVAAMALSMQKNPQDSSYLGA